MDYYLKKSPTSQQWQAVRSSGPVQMPAAPQQSHLLTVPTFRPQGSQPMLLPGGLSHVHLQPRASLANHPLLHFPHPAASQRPAAVSSGLGGLAFQPQVQLRTLAGQSSGLSQLVGISNSSVTQQHGQNSFNLSARASESPAQTELVLRGFSLLDRANFLKVGTHYSLVKE